MTATAAKETLGFQAEVKQLLHLMVHSLYGNKEIFLRELISNASDACDKLRFESVASGVSMDDDTEFRIRVSYDAAARTITISDNGIGLSRQEVIEHIGTIAKSGTREFFQRLATDAAKDAALIGQFGVGFYSSFIVADRVTLVTRRAGAPAEDGVRWESAGEGDYTLEAVHKDARGTDVILHLRPEEDELLSGSRLRMIIRKYSDHITFPILMKKEAWDATTKTHGVTDEDEQINQGSALWARPKSDITEAQYEEFYKHVGHDFEPPLAWTHAKVEGRQEFTQLFYIPRRAPFDLWDRNRRHDLKLYVRRVFIMDSADQLLPAYLRFVRGIVDSSDLPLNVSREILQQSSDVAQIRAASVKRVLGLLEDLAKNQKEKYSTFWSEFGRVLKEGIIEDAGNRERIAALLRFTSTSADTGDQTVSLADYVGRMKDGQSAIYYVTADGYAAATHSPHLEVFRKHGVEVLLLGDRVDEWVVAHLTEFDGKPLQSAAQGDLDTSAFGEAATPVADEIKNDEYKDLLTRIQEALKDRASQVRLTHRLTDSPACLVADEQGMSRHLERMLRESGQPVPATKPIFEINPDHPIVQRLKEESDAALFAEWTQVLFDQAILAEGTALEDPAAFVKRLNTLTLALAGATASKIWTPGRSLPTCMDDPSGHFREGRFFNPDGANGQPLSKAPRMILERRTPWPAEVPVESLRPSRPATDADLIVTFIGHATFLIATSAGGIITDPVFAQRASPLSFAGPRRVRQPGVRFDDLPPISLVLLSHNHYDHCDLRALRQLKDRFDPFFVTLLGNGRLLRSVGLTRVEEIDWWQKASSAPMPLWATQAQHFSARTPFDRNRALWGGFVMQLGAQRLFFAGDSGYGPHFSAIKARYGPIDVALLPIGAYEPRWFMKDIHMNPAEAVQAHLDLALRLSIPMHYGTFQLTTEGIDEPLAALARAQTAAGIAADCFRTLEVGQSLDVGH